MINGFLNEKVAVLVRNKDEAEKVKELAYENGFKWAYGVREFNPYGFDFLGEFVYMVPEDSEVIIMIKNGKLMKSQDLPKEIIEEDFGQVIDFSLLGI